MKKIIFILLLARFFTISGENTNLDSLLTVITDKNIPLFERYSMTASIGYYRTDEQIEICKALIPEAKEYSDKIVIVKLYSLLNFFYTQLSQYETAENYLDSAFYYEDQIDNNVILGVLHYSAGTFYGTMTQQDKAHLHNYHAIEYFEQAGLQNNPIMNELYFNLTNYYSHKNDTAHIKEILEKMMVPKNELEGGTNHDYTSILTYSIIASYYEACFRLEPSQTHYMDSVYIYNKLATAIFEQLDVIPTGYDYQIASNYYQLSQTFLYRDNTQNRDSLLYYVQIADKYANPNDSVIKINRSYILADYYFQKDEYKLSKEYIDNALQILTFIPNLTYYEKYISSYKLLSAIYEKQGLLGQALEAFKKSSEYENRFHEEMNYYAINELKTKYEVNKKEAEIERLIEITNFQNRIKFLYIGLMVFFILTTILIFSYSHLRKKKLADSLKIIQLEKNKTELKYSLEAERANKMELEKYDALLDIHFKEIEIEDKTAELNSLIEEKNRLNAQIIDYSERLKKYENKTQVVPDKLEEAMYNIIIKGIEDLLKRLPTDSEIKYKKKLSQINKDFIIYLLNASGKTITRNYLKYALCCSLQMDIDEIARCFSVEAKTIHMVRYRLKQKLNLDKDIDLDNYLYSSLQNTQHYLN